MQQEYYKKYDVKKILLGLVPADGSVISSWVLLQAARAKYDFIQQDELAVAYWALLHENKIERVAGEGVRRTGV